MLFLIDETVVSQCNNGNSETRFAKPKDIYCKVWFLILNCEGGERMRGPLPSSSS